jgi:hypothetical protein
VQGEGASGAGSPTALPRPSLSSPGGQRQAEGVNLERQGSIRQVLQAAQSEARKYDRLNAARGEVDRAMVPDTFVPLTLVVCRPPGGQPLV